MWSLETLEYLNQQAAKKARRQHKEPHVPTPDDIDKYPPFPFPHLGPFEPPGWEQVEDVIWFADSSGWGNDNEPALSVRQLKNELRRYIEENPGHGFGIVDCGQFQCYVAAFRPVETKEIAA